MIEFQDYWTISPEDHTRGRGGFNGEWFDSPGITDAEFDSEDAACRAIQRRFRNWKRIETGGLGITFKKPGAQKFLVVNWSTRIAR